MILIYKCVVPEFHAKNIYARYHRMRWGKIQHAHELGCFLCGIMRRSGNQGKTRLEIHAINTN